MCRLSFAVGYLFSHKAVRVETSHRLQAHTCWGSIKSKHKSKSPVDISANQVIFETETVLLGLTTASIYLYLEDFLGDIVKGMILFVKGIN